MSHRKFIISDLHLGHKNLALHRGFSSIEEHDGLIIENWKMTVNKRDTIFILGDITMEKAGPLSILDELPGIKKVVLGNHDSHCRELLKYVNKVYGMYEENGNVFTHCPIHESQLTRYRYNYHGHIHSEVIPHEKYINVCCEQINYNPLQLFK